MFSIRSCMPYAALVVLAVSVGADGSVISINSAVVQWHVFNDIPGATLSGVNNYPSSVSLEEQGVSAASGHTERDVWWFSSNGTSPYLFQHNDYFQASFTLDLTGFPTSPRKEAGFLFRTVNEGDTQFIVDTDGHVVEFGGISFYLFSGNGIVSYNSGDSITLGLSYFMDENGNNAMQFWANGFNSPIFELGPTVGSGTLDFGDGSTLGGYFQIENDPSNPTNSGTAIFTDISITAVPEPSVVAIISMGLLPLLSRRRRA